MSTPETPEQLFADLLAAEPSRPFVTYYDESTGERTELSVKSLANWVAKTHHLLGTELGLGVGDRAFVELPAHWLSVPVVLGCLTAGLQFAPADADVAFTVESADQPDPARAAADGLRTVRGPGGRRCRHPPGGNQRLHRGGAPAGRRLGHGAAGGAATDPFTAELSRGAAVARARAFAAGQSWTRGARVLTTRPWAGPDDWVETLLAPLAVGGSVVYVRNGDDPDGLARRMAQERCTARL